MHYYNASRQSCHITHFKRLNMDTKVFERPVSVYVGLGYVRTVRTVMDAYMMLNDWTSTRKCHAHEMALKACKAALKGDVDAETVRSLFMAFALRNHCLAEAGDMADAA
jgi:Protein of unknown function (DUF982)